MSDTWQIMVASSDLENRRHLVSILDQQGFGTFCAANVSQCREILDGHDVGLVFCDRSFADGDYRDVLTAAAGRKPGTRARVVLLAAAADSEQYKRAKDLGILRGDQRSVPADGRRMDGDSRKTRRAAGRRDRAHQPRGWAGGRGP